MESIYTYNGSENANTLAYDGLGNRVKKSSPMVGDVVFVYDAFGNMAAEYGAGAMTACSPCYLFRDPVGTVRLVADQTQTVVKRYDVMPFGEQISPGTSWANGRSGDVYSPFSTVKWRYAGSHKEDQSGEWPGNEMGARQYNPGYGRFVTPDENLVDQNVRDPLSWNLYSYARNNPLKYVDPSGRRIELTGETEEERNRQLEAIRRTVGEEAGKRLQINKDKKAGSYYVGIVGETSTFRDINPVASGFARIIGLSETAKFSLVGGDEEMKLAGPGGRTLNGNHAEGATGLDASGQLRVYVKDPSEGYSDVTPFKMSGFPWFGTSARTAETVVGHEFGHALGYMMQRMAGQRPNPAATDAGALNFENRVRRLRDPNARIRIAH